jgi:UDP-N-acetyl-D-glucosamine dehydrogenase
MKINIWEVIEAAKTKPYGFQAFYPGPGIGGHCIPLDPFYLEYIAKGFDFDLTMINTAGNINNLMPYRMMNKIAFALNRRRKSLNGSTILFLGVAYKPDIDDARESPALLVMEQVAKKGAIVIYHDPYIPELIDEKGQKWSGLELCDSIIANADCVVFTTNHTSFDVEHIVEIANLVVDMRNAVKRVEIEDDKVFKL